MGVSFFMRSADESKISYGKILYTPTVRPKMNIIPINTIKEGIKTRFLTPSVKIYYLKHYYEQNLLN